MVRALQGERVFARSSYELMRRSNKQAADILFWTNEYLPQEEKASWEQFLRDLPGGDAMADFLKRELFCQLWRFAWLDQDQLHYLRYLQGLIASGRNASRQKSLQKAPTTRRRVGARLSRAASFGRPESRQPTNPTADRALT